MSDRRNISRFIIFLRGGISPRMVQAVRVRTENPRSWAASSTDIKSVFGTGLSVGMGCQLSFGSLRIGLEVLIFASHLPSFCIQLHCNDGNYLYCEVFS